jgi:hypothetical protein
MKRNNLMHKHLSKIFVSFLLISSTCFAELLIVKKTQQGIEPLTEQESFEYNDTIANILMKYQWPMVIGSELTREEKRELLMPSKENAEEIFIQKKLNEAIPDLDLEVIFIPTTLYELYVLNWFLTLFSPRSDINWGNSFSIFNQNHTLSATVNTIDFLKFSPGQVSKNYKLLFCINTNNDNFFQNPNVPKSEIIQKINSIYKKNNQMYYLLNERLMTENKLRAEHSVNTIDPSLVTGDASPFLFINNRLAAIFSKMGTCTTAQECSELIKKQCKKMALGRYSALKTRLNKDNLKSILVESEDMTYLYLCKVKKEREDSISEILKCFNNPQALSCINKIIDLEYQARSENKGILLRGTSLIEVNSNINPKVPAKNILGSTIQYARNYPYGSPTLKSIFSDYTQNRLFPLSISFGTTLFAGFIFDIEASAFFYLMQPRPSNKNVAGYALFINKYEYLYNQISNLFFIPALSPLASLFQEGECFHARTKAAITKKPENGTPVSGLKNSGTLIKDPGEQILIIEDPLKHAARFSEFIKNNGRVIQNGDNSILTEAEKLAVDGLLDTQKELADFYTGLIGVKKFFDISKERKTKNK